MERNKSKVKTDKYKIEEEKKSMPIYAKYGIAALAILVAIICGVFIWFNIEGGYVAKVGNEKISVKEYNLYLSIQKGNMLYQARSLDPNLDEKTFWDTKIENVTALEIAKQRTLEGIRDIKIQVSEAKSSGIKLDSSEIKNVDDYINEVVIENNQVGSGNRIRANKYFEENYGAGLDVFRKTQLENALVQKLQSEQVKKLDIKDTDIKSYYEKNPDWYKEDMDMRKGAEEAVWARHILIKAEKDAAQDVKDAAKKKAQDLLDKLKAGADFAALAKENSDDGNAQYGGDYVFGKGRMVPEFDTATFSLRNGQLYDTLVQTDFGFHIIKLEEKYAKDQPVSLKCATEYRDFGTGFISQKLYQKILNEWIKDARYTVEPNESVYGSIK